MSAAPPTLGEDGLRKCARAVDHALKHSPRVQVLLRKIQALGCPTAPAAAGGAEFVSCEDVFGGAPVGGAYSTDARRVIMNPAAASRMSQTDWTRGVTHELVHAYDACRADMARDSCAHVACTEVRAANLSGECDFSAELSRMPVRLLTGGIGAHQQKCVRRRAELSVSFHEQCGGAAGAPAAVAAVWAPCYADTAPFASN